MATLNELLVAEGTEHEFKSELEVKHPKSWMKTVSAFANGFGGSIHINMADGSLIQTLDIENVPSIRRNPTVADVFHRLDFAERQGSGLRKIREETAQLHDYTDEFAPKFISTPSAFHVVFKNMNFDVDGDLDGTAQPTNQGTHQDNAYAERIASLVEFCSTERTREEMQQHTGIMNRGHFRTNILKPLLDAGKLKMTIPDRPNNQNQKYVRAE